MKRNISFLLIFAFGISACNPITQTPTPVILVDSFFSGYAFLDANGNGQLDSADTPLKDAIFIVQFEGGAEFGALTDQTGNAFVTIPSAVQYPVTLFMKPPEDGPFTLIGPLSIVLQETASEKASFLFASK
ncbi:MAG TPA: hypothetical protein VFI68_00785 [Anaerolineales bacterium]|nr:hypothetical protein [Anaerolineales bacterium]